MKVVVGERTFNVYWMHNNKSLVDFLIHAEQYDLAERIKDLPCRKQFEAIKENIEFLNETAEKETRDTIMNCDATTCFINEGDKTYKARVIRYHLDSNNRDKARKYSLAKVLKEIYPDDREARKIFWDTYLNRCKRPEPQEAEPQVQVV